MATKKTSRGQAVDMQTLALQNEKEIAVGNMGVNARGDKINSTGKVVQPKTEQAQAYTNPKAVKTVSIKDAVDVSATKTMEQPPVTEKAKPTKAPKATKAKEPKMKEVELPNGDIELVEDTE